VPHLAWFTPLPPVRSGISAYSAELLPVLCGTIDVDVFVDTGAGSSQLAWSDRQGWTVPRGPGVATAAPAPPAADPGAPRLPRVWPAFDFPRLHGPRPYDLVVYQLGNAPCHDYMWAYLVRVPGLVVLHDGMLHHARARALLRDGRADDYRAEFRFNHPAANPLIAEHVIAGLPGACASHWPMRGLVVAAARAIVVHGTALEADLRREHPGTAVTRVRMGVRAHRPAGRRPPRPRDALVFAAFGLVTPEKRVPLLLEVFAAAFGRTRDARLWLVGDTVPHYDARADAERLGITDLVTLAGYASDDDLDDWLDAADVCVCLRWPTTGESSASWLRCLAAGKPTVVTGFRHSLDVPTLDARSGAIVGGSTGPHRPRSWEDAIAVSVDLVDEREALGLAMRRLAGDAVLRERLGTNARARWARDHTVETMAGDYRAAIERVCATNGGGPITENR
jgi:glycosyltransferase involved in cell wall biosynthesis